MRQSLLIKAIIKPTLVVKEAKLKWQYNSENMARFLSQWSTHTQIINHKEIRILGLRRTGNHAITNWIIKQLQGQVCYLNNLIINENPFYRKYEALRQYHPQYQEQTKQLLLDKQGKFVPKDCLIYSYEDYAIEQIIKQRFALNHELYFGKSTCKYDVLILRDPFNLIASRIKGDKMKVKARNQTAIDLWIAYAKEFLGETNYLTNNKVCISYNQWVKDTSYRQSIATKLGLNFSDVGIDSVQKQGGGSSFDGREFDGHAFAMNVFNRWQSFQADKSFRLLLNNEELIHYSQLIFGHLPGTESLRLN